MKVDHTLNTVIIVTKFIMIYCIYSIYVEIEKMNI